MSRLMAEPILSVKNLHIEFSDHAPEDVTVDGFNLDLYKGEILGIVGESGSGKSISALAMAGLLYRKDILKSGSIITDGIDLMTCDEKSLCSIRGKQIGMIFQDPMSSLNPVQRIGGQVEEVLRIHYQEMSSADRKQRALNMLRDCGLDDAENIYSKYPFELSGGMLQRVMIAAAMIADPKILIADEPTTALDVTVQEQIITLIRRINHEKGTSIIFISHDLSLVRQLCERVLVMQNGSIIESGNVEELFENPRAEYTKKLISCIPQVMV